MGVRIDEMLAAAQTELDRVAPADLAAEQRDGALVAAITLRRLGVHRATDLEGGFQAWLRV